MKTGDTFVAPITKLARFPGRKMRVRSVETINYEGEDQVWIDAVPVDHRRTDEYGHSTYRLDEDGHVIPV